MLYPGNVIDSPVPKENFFSEDGKRVFIKQSDHDKIMNFIKNTDPYEVRYNDDFNAIVMRINWLYYKVSRRGDINDLFIVESDDPR